MWTACPSISLPTSHLHFDASLTALRLLLPHSPSATGPHFQSHPEKPPEPISDEPTCLTPLMDNNSSFSH